MPEEHSKFSGALAKLKHRSAEQPAALPTPSLGTEPVRGRGRPPGKRSDPDYQPTTVLLRKNTKKTAARLLEDTNAAQDLSDLIEQLLTEWIQKRT
jgi:SRSO17 transposase